MMRNSGMCTSSQNWIKTKIKTPICLNSKGNEALPNVRLMYDHVFSWTTIIVPNVVIIVVHCTISMQIRLTMMSSIKVWKSFLIIIRLSICHWVWWGKRWDTCLWTCAPLFKIIVTIVSWNVLWVVVRSLL
jgi:hypothetical protein